MAFKLQAQDLQQESLLVQIQAYFRLIRECRGDPDYIETLTHLGEAAALKAQDIEKQDVCDHRKLGDLLDAKQRTERKPA